MCKVRLFKYLQPYTHKTPGLCALHCKKIIKPQIIKINERLTQAASTENNKRTVRVFNGQKTTINIAGINLTFHLVKKLNKTPVVTIVVKEPSPRIEKAIKYEEINYGLAKETLSSIVKGKLSRKIEPDEDVKTTQSLKQGKAWDKRKVIRASQFLKHDKSIKTAEGQTNEQKTGRNIKTRQILNMSRTHEYDKATTCMVQKHQPNEQTNCLTRTFQNQSMTRKPYESVKDFIRTSSTLETDEPEHLCTENHQLGPSQSSQPKLITSLLTSMSAVPKRGKCKKAENKEDDKNCVLAKLFCECKTKPVDSPKISVIGAGQVGMTISAFLLQQRLSQNLTIVDLNSDLVKAEVLDLSHGMSFMGSPVINGCSDFEITRDSQYIIITAGVRPGGKSRLEIAQDTANIIKEIVPALIELSPKAKIIMVSNPVDVMAWVAQKVGNIPPERCISSGCNLDSARFRYYISQRLQVPPTSVQAYIIGEHGDSAVPVWSSVSIGGVRLQKIHPEIGTPYDSECWSKVHEEVITGGRAVSKTKGYTNWAVAMSVCDIVAAMTENSGRVLSVGTEVKNINCIEEPVYLSLPCMLNAEGVTKILRLPLTDWETCKLLQSAEILSQVQKSIEL